MLHRIVRALPALLLLCAAAVNAQAGSAQTKSARIHAHAGAEMGQARAGSESLRVEVDGIALDLSLRPNALLLEGLGEVGRQRLRDAGHRFLEGEIVGLEGSWVRLSRVDGRYSGAWFDGSELFLLDPAEAVAGLLSEPPKGGHVVYRLSDLELPAFGEDAVEAPAFAPRPTTLPKRASYRAFAGHLGKSMGLADGARSAVRQLNLTVVTDTQFSARHGANRDAVVATRLNVVDGIYSDQFQTRIAVTELRHLGDNANMTSTSGSTLLGQFRTFMTTGAGSTIPKGGLNHLLSGRDFDGNTAGVAYVNVLCSSNSGYGINRMPNNNNTWSLVVAHELGHNFGASHDGQTGSNCASQTGAWLMSPSINGSSTFSPCSRERIEPRIAAASCLVPLVVEGALFGNGFERD